MAAHGTPIYSLSWNMPLWPSVHTLQGLHPKPVQTVCPVSATDLLLAWPSASPRRLTETAVAPTGLSPSLPNSPSAPTGSGWMP